MSKIFEIANFLNNYTLKEIETAVSLVHLEQAGVFEGAVVTGDDLPRCIDRGKCLAVDRALHFGLKESPMIVDIITLCKRTGGRVSDFLRLKARDILRDGDTPPDGTKLPPLGEHWAYISPYGRMIIFDKKCREILKPYLDAAPPSDSAESFLSFLFWKP